ncbi:MAG: dihydrolipoyl dehydrogenase [Prevotella sp.]|jgi:dihydrolipoamide dehydrogenase
METDLLIIGSGPGGYKTAEYAAGKGLKVALVERSALGGTCLNCGCIPTKSLLFDAARIDRNQNLETQYAAALNRKDDIVKGLVSGVGMLMKQSGVIVIEGEASFISPQKVQVGENVIEAKDVIIATGSKPKMLRLEDGDRHRVMTSEALLSCPTLPQRLCIVGAGVIGLEMAQMFSSFGSEVTLVEFMKECLPTMDQEIARRVRRLMEKRGVKFILNAGVTRIDDTKVFYTNQKNQQQGMVEADAVLMSVGRAPMTDGLNIEAAGVEVSPKGIIVNDNMQTSVPHVYAIGDVNGRMLLAHAATFQGYRAVNHILGDTDDIRLDIIPSAVFTHPEIAAVGLTEEVCKQRELEYKVYKAMYRSNGRAVAMEATDGLVKLLCDANDVIIGCHAYGEDAAAMVQEISSLMNFNVTRSRLAQLVHIHPTLSEILLDTK